MKKILLALGIIVGLLVPATILTASPSYAACEYRTKLSAHRTIETHLINEDGGATHAGWYEVWGQLNYYACGTHANVDVYRVWIQNNSGRCGWVDYWRVNPNIIGGWNPGEKSTNCNDDATDLLVWDAGLNAVGIEPSDPSEDRCIGGNIEKDINNHPNDTYSVPTVCVTFAL